MKTLALSLVMVVVGSIHASAAGELTWQELARRPELWPAQCTIKVTIPFDGGVSVKFPLGGVGTHESEAALPTG